MIRTARALIAIPLLLALSACQRSSSPNTTDAVDQAVAVPSPVATTAPEFALEPIGVAECDDFLAKQAACVARHGASAQAVLLPLYEDQRNKWKAMAEHPAMNAALRSACQQMLGALPPDYPESGCD